MVLDADAGTGAAAVSAATHMSKWQHVFMHVKYLPFYVNCGSFGMGTDTGTGTGVGTRG